MLVLRIYPQNNEMRFSIVTEIKLTGHLEIRFLYSRHGILSLV